MEYNLTAYCPKNAIVFDDGTKIIDYSYLKTKYCAYKKHTENNKDYQNNMLNYFKTYTRDEILNLTKQGYKWPIYFGWVIEHENSKCS